jgi:NAD(P)-dependent dehydrogenase (short-subunit alcohol dehydrogenase family)
MGSISRSREFMFQPAPAYKISKAALNMLVVQYAAYLEKEEFIVFSIDPGVSIYFPIQRDLPTEAD